MFDILRFEDEGFNGLNDIKLTQKDLSGSIRAGRGSGTLPIAPKVYIQPNITILNFLQVLYDKLWEYDLNWIKKFDSDLADFSILLKASEDVLVARARFDYQQITNSCLHFNLESMLQCQFPLASLSVLGHVKS